VNRLGAQGPEEVKKHIWFKDFKWKDLIDNKLKAPFVPNKGKDNFNLKIRMSSTSDNNASKETINVKDFNEERINNFFSGYYYFSDTHVNVSTGNN